MSNSGNILKSNFIKFSSSNTRVIDTNALVAKRLEGYSNVLREAGDEPKEDVTEEEGFEALDMLTGDPESEEPVEMEPLKPTVIKSSPLEDVQAECNRMTEEAREEAERILSEAKANADSIKDAARQEGYKAGSEQARQEYEAKMAEIDSLKASLDEEFDKRVAEIEPDMVNVITGVYEHVFGQNFYSRRDVLICLINRALMHVDPSATVTVNVSSVDYEMVIGMKSVMLDRISLRYEPEIISRDDFTKGQAKIETPFGIIDCSIDTELRELSRALIMLSYEGSKEA